MRAKRLNKLSYLFYLRQYRLTLAGRIRKHVEIITGILGTLTIIAGGMILFFFCGGRRFLGVISFKCQPTQSEVLTEAQHKRKDSDQSQSLVQVPRQKLEEILTVCKETKRCVQEVLDKDTAEADNMNAVNVVQCASSTANSHREVSLPAAGRLHEQIL